MTVALASPPRIAPPVTDRELLQSISLALNLVALAEGRTVAFSLEQFGQIDLPPLHPSDADDQALIRSIATLYLASQLELAGLISTAETLCGLAMSGSLQVDLGKAATLIAHFWQGRHQRFQESERREFFARLFGSDSPPDSAGLSPNAEFEELMIILCESLYKLDERRLDDNYGSPAAQFKVRAAARNLMDNLTHRGGGMTPLAAREILTTLQQSIEMLRAPAVQHAFGVSSVWDVVRAVARRYQHDIPDAQAYVRRGRSGLVVLSWAADALQKLGQTSSPLVTLDHPVIAAAEEWLEASLAIREADGTDITAQRTGDGHPAF